MSRSFVPAVLIWMAVAISTVSTADRIQAQTPRAAQQLSAEERTAKLIERNRLWEEAGELRAAGKLEESLERLSRHNDRQRELFGDKTTGEAEAFEQIALNERDRQHWPQARTAAAETLAIREKVHGPDDWRTGDARIFLADIELWSKLTEEDREALRQAEKANAWVVSLYRSGKFTEGIALARQTAETQERLLGPDHPDTSTSLNDLAHLYQAQGNYAAAEPLYLRALAIREKALGPENPHTAKSLNNLAGLYESQGNYAAAEPLYLRALKIREIALGPENPETAASLNDLASLFRAQSNYAAAEPLYLRALAIHEKALGPDHRDTATSLNNLAGLYRAQGNYAAAEPLYLRALAIREKALGPDHPYIARSLNNLAHLYESQGNYAVTEPLYQRALAICEKALGPEHPDTATSLNNLANLYKAQGNYAAAEPLYLRVLAINEKALGPEHRDTATSLNNLAGLYKAQGNYAAAEPLYQRALASTEKALGPDHPSTATSLNNRALLFWETGRSESARPLVGRGFDIDLRHLEQTAAIQTEQQQFLMAAVVSGDLNEWLTVTSDDPVGASEAWKRVLAWKGLTTTRQIGLRQALKDDPTYAEFRRVSQQLSTVVINPPLPPSDPKALAAWNKRAADLRHAWLEQKTQLEAEHQRLEKELAKKSSVFRQEHKRQTVTPENVVAALHESSQPTALVDLIRYWFLGRKAKGETSEWRVAAFVIRSDGKIQRVELGGSNDINDAVTVWRKTYGQPAGQQDPGRELRRLLWDPLEPSLAGIETVLVSPDGVLAQLPWGALPGRKPGTYLVEEQSIAVIPVPQMLPEILQQQPHSGPPASLLVAGDIDYGGDPGVPQDLLAHRGAVGRQRDGRWLQFGKLDNAQSEMASIERRYRKEVRDGDELSMDGVDATEAAFREQAPQHAWVHLITHGFFAPPEWSNRLSDAAAQHSRESTPPAPVLAGIGAGLEVKDGHCLVTQLVTAVAAAKDGRLQVGDEILSMAQAAGDWSEVKGKELPAIVAMIRGPVGTVVRIKVRPQKVPEREIELALKRAALPTAAAAKPAPVNSGLLSGLAFAGANKPPEPRKDDGILTALEVSALDLSKVDTVVLSACETGLGQVAGGEGLLGLQRSFQVAGAKTVVASLWKVPDAATSELMQRFYENLWARKMGKLAALREAQIHVLRNQVNSEQALAKGNRGLSLVDDRPADAGALPPFYWAAFVLSGDWR
jgi:CHAT domain-containing protein